MRKRISLLIAALSLALTLSVGGAAFAVNTTSSDFERGTCTEETIHGSHGTFETHHGQCESSGKETGSGSGKVTGSSHTIQ